jgi:steroid 5-alpha reductase family enzyme
MSAGFAAAALKRRNDLADVAWGVGFIVAAVAAWGTGGVVSGRTAVVTVLVSVWGLRLAFHIARRNRGKKEDRRYRAWRESWGRHALVRSFFQVFLFQGLLLVIISLPVTLVILSGGPGFSVLDAAGILVWTVGFLFEAVADFQLARFKRSTAGAGRIMTSGLWKYSRHPNYFGEVVLWWGIYIIALSVPGGWATFLGPLLITVLILGVSGIPLLEKKYAGNPEFEEYRRRTSAFFPLPQRKQ